jgi:prepilin-type processing-associated H-X9-DG protein
MYTQHGTLAILLPYMEQGQVLEAGTGYNFRLNWNDPVNQPAASIRIPTYKCPSCPSTDVILPNPPAWTWTPAVADYMAISRSNNVSAVWTSLGLTMPGPSSINSVLTANRRTPASDILDGLSNTLMLGESAARHEGWVTKGKYADPTTAGWGLRGAWAQSSNNIVCAGTAAPVPVPPMPPNPTPVKANSAANGPSAITINAWNQGELYSFHPGACNVAMGDASVRTLRANLSMATLQKLAARADGYPVPLEN